MMSSKKLLLGIFSGIGGLVCLLVVVGQIRHSDAIQRHLAGMELAWEQEVAEPENFRQHRRTFKQHQKELVALGNFQERWFEIPVKLGATDGKELIEALKEQANSKPMFTWSMGPKTTVKVIAPAQEMPQWETLLSRWNAASVPVPPTPEKTMVQSLKARLGISETPYFDEQNLFGLESAGDAPIEFTARVERIENNSKLLATDPGAIPYIIHFKLVKGEIPQFPNHRKLRLLLPHETGIDSIGRFKVLQEVVFVCSADGALRGTKNVPSFAELKKAAQGGAKGKTNESSQTVKPSAQQ